MVYDKSNALRAQRGLNCPEAFFLLRMICIYIYIYLSIYIYMGVYVHE